MQHVFQKEISLADIRYIGKPYSRMSPDEQKSYIRWIDLLLRNMVGGNGINDTHYSLYPFHLYGENTVKKRSNELSHIIQ